MRIESWEKMFEEKMAHIALVEDPAHDLLHLKRVVKMAKFLCDREQGKFEVVVPAAWLHDFVVIPKNSPLRAQASRIAAKEAIAYLNSIEYPSEYLDQIAHAIEAHSFSANIEPKTIEAKIVQDADRLDGLGAIGLARCFVTAGLLKRPLYDELDPFCENREPADSKFTIDHVFQKLFKTAESLQTPTALLLGSTRVEVLKSYLEDLKSELR